MKPARSEPLISERVGESDTVSSHRRGIPSCLMLQAAALMAASVWLCLDPAAEWLIARVQSDRSHVLLLLRDTAAQLGYLSGSTLAAVLLVAVGSMAWWLASLVQLPQSNCPPVYQPLATRPDQTRIALPVSRSLKSLLILTTFCAGWFGLAANASSLAWHGKRARLAFSVQQLDWIAERLRADWPAGDSQLPEIGPFTAYPFGQPRVLLLMQPPSLQRKSLHVCAIERSESGALKFQLGGTVCDDWAEWHPQSSSPRSFVGGLEDEHRLQTYSPLGGGWYLVRYEANHRP